MLRIVCDTCEGFKVKSCDYFVNISEVKPCETCNGKGYIEHEGSLEDLELAQAIKLLFETGQHHIIQTYKGCRQAYFYDKEMLIDWYKLQKGGVSNA